MVQFPRCPQCQQKMTLALQQSREKCPSWAQCPQACRKFGTVCRFSQGFKILVSGINADNIGSGFLISMEFERLVLSALERGCKGVIGSYCLGRG